jgi:DNA (cytosine-5)-methyltransferase 1
MGYAVGAVPFPAAGVGAPHLRHRLYWVADTEGREEQGTWPRGEAPPEAVGRHDPRPPVAGWDNPRWLYCRDGTTRPIEPGIYPLAPGSPESVVELRAFGNGLCVPAARAFVEAYLAYR